MILDPLFFAAMATFGWGLSLATYRIFALHYHWPMGRLQESVPVAPVLIGLACLLIAFVFAAAHGGEMGGWLILTLGLLFAVLWTALLKVGSQVSLLLAPAAAIILIFGWLILSF